MIRMRGSNLNELPLHEASRLIQSKSVHPFELVSDCMIRIEEIEDELGAFTTFERKLLFNGLAAIEHMQMNSPLFGVPVGVKDIMETAGIRTTMGSEIYRDYVPERDAVCVAMLRAAGAIIAGKTESTEFAFFFPGKTRNPHNADHTPGGSSMGSAAAVSKMMLPLALGTQTAGSVIRPAAYCGVTGYKASHGAISLAGVCGFAQSLDSIGFFVREVRDLTIVRNALFGAPLEFAPVPESIRVGFVRTPHWSLTETDQRQLLEDVCQHLDGRGFKVSEMEVGPSDGALTEAQITVMAYEGCRSLSAEYRKFPQLLSDQLNALIELGQNTTFESYRKALSLSELWQRKLRKLFRDYDVLITPSAPGEAPKGLNATGDPIFNRMWTLLKVPCIHLPVSFGASGLPLGIQLVGAFNQDDRLISIARQIESRLADFQFEPETSENAD